MANLHDPEILIIEDNPSDAELTLLSLRTHGLAKRFVHVRDGAEALEYLFGTARKTEGALETHLRLILLDLKLPKVSGLEVLREVKSNDRTRKIPVVVLTSSGEERDLRECYRLGANSYIVKPVVFDEFVRAVSAIGLYWMELNKVPQSNGGAG